MLKPIQRSETMIQVRKTKTVKESAVKPQLIVRSKLEIMQRHFNQESRRGQFDSYFQKYLRKSDFSENSYHFEVRFFGFFFVRIFFRQVLKTHFSGFFFAK